MKRYLCNVDEVTSEEFSLWYSRMSQQRKEKCNRYRDEKAKKLCIAADHLTRKALSKALSLPEDKISVSVSPAGKPYVEGNPVFFSLSHAFPYAVCVVSKSPVGVDIERIRPVSVSPDRFCTENELEYLQDAKHKEEYRERLIRIWTKKEAFFKLSGTLPRTDKKIDTLSPDFGVRLDSERMGEFILTVAKSLK